MSGGCGQRDWRDHNPQGRAVNRCGQEKRRGVLGETCVIVTGAGGRIGRLLRRAWTQEPPAGLRPLWAGRGEGFDIAWDLLAGPAPDWPQGAVVLHLAGVVGGGDAALRQNSAMVAPLLQACRRNRVSALLFASTAAVYRPSALPADEETAADPQSPYGRAKAAAEALLLQAQDLRVTSLRLGNVAGADALLSPRAGPVALDPVPGREGGPVRSWIGPLTLARALACLCRRAAAAPLPPVLNLAAAPPLAMADLLRAAGRDWAFGPPNPAVVPDAMMATARVQALCPLPPATPAGIAAELAVLVP